MFEFRSLTWKGAGELFPRISGLRRWPCGSGCGARVTVRGVCLPRSVPLALRPRIAVRRTSRVWAGSGMVGWIVGGKWRRRGGEGFQVTGQPVEGGG